MCFGYGMKLGWGGFDRAKLDMLILIRIPFSFHMGLPISPDDGTKLQTTCKVCNGPSG